MSSGNPVYDDNHPLWAVEGVAPLMRVRCDVSDEAPGYSSYALTPVGVAQGIADWVEYSQARRTAAGSTLQRHSFFVQNWGMPSDTPDENITNTFTLCRNWDDRVTDVGLSDANRIHTPWCENGISQLRAWTEEFMAELAAQLDARNLPAPNDLHWDFEGRPLTQPLLGSTGLWDALQADARWSANSIDGDPANTMENLWAAARKSDGSAMTVNTAATIFTQANAEFEAWSGVVFARAAEYAIAQALYEPARATFPGILCGNYNFLPRTPIQTWWRLTKSFSPRSVFAGTSLPYSDFASPEVYPIPASFLNATSPGTLAEFMAVYGLTYTGVAATDLRAWWMEMQKANLRALRSYYAGDIAVWLPFPGYEVTYTAPSYTLTATADDVVELGTYAARDLGITDFIWFMNTATNPTTSQPYLANLDAYPDMIEAVNDAAINYATSASVRYNRPRRRRFR